MMNLISVGEAAPPFTLEGTDGVLHSLEDVLKTSRALLVFYPANNTPG